MTQISHPVIHVTFREATLKRKIRGHLHTLGFERSADGSLRVNSCTKDNIRALHSSQRLDRQNRNCDFLSHRVPRLIKYFATGSEVEPTKISPVLERILAGTWQSDLFRMASLTWSVPVSSGFGRRLRYLVWDKNNGKIIGLIAIGDPVFNLSVRDSMIGWDVHGRRARLVNIMDAYVLGSLPPYSFLLGGKMVACLIRTRNVYEDFEHTYGKTTGIISRKQKNARLLAVTTTSALGRSSVYNRLRLDGAYYFRSIGYTNGWGHFHIPDELFAELRDYLRRIGHPYADLHQFGQGPNWRLRTTRAALEELGFNDDLLRHGIQREVFISLLASNATKMLLTGTGSPDLSSLLDVSEVADLALERWILPRSRRRLEYQQWTRDDLMDVIEKHGRTIQTDAMNASEAGGYETGAC